MKKIIYVLIVICFSILMTACKEKETLSVTEYKNILINLGYDVDEIYDKEFNNGDLKRWVGLSGDLYAAIFEYNSNEAAKEKKNSMTEYFDNKSMEIIYIKLSKKTLVVIATDAQNKPEAQRIVDKLSQ